MCSRHDDGRRVDLQALLQWFDSMGVKYTIDDLKDGMFTQELIAPTKPAEYLPYPFPIGARVKD